MKDGLLLSKCKKTTQYETNEALDILSKCLKLSEKTCAVTTINNDIFMTLSSRIFFFSPCFWGFDAVEQMTKLDWKRDVSDGSHVLKRKPLNPLDKCNE